MVDNATKLSHHEFRITVRRWEMLADLDGAHRTAEEAHEGRRAGIAEVGEEIHLHARGGLAQGAVMMEIFERFCDAEFTADWDDTLARYGDKACYSLMPRTRCAAPVRCDVRDLRTRRHRRPRRQGCGAAGQLRHRRPHPRGATSHGTGDTAVPADPRQRRCETASGSRSHP